MGKATVQCQCGKVETRRVSDILNGKPYGCRPCTRRKIMADTVKTPEWAGHHQKMREAAVKAVAVPPGWSQLRRNCQVAKDRCENPKNMAYPRYGGRGIGFEFPSASAMAQWVQDNLGTRPPMCSLDRIDNDAGYAPGNLRWADRYVQGQNKRPYRGSVYGDRIRALQKDRPDIGYETIRTWITKGMSDDEIRTKPRSTSGRRRIRHS